MGALDHEYLLELLHYDHCSGIFTRKVRRGTGIVGSVAGSVRRMMLGERLQEYRWIEIDGRSYGEHRLAWFYMMKEWPETQVDHRDGNSLNNAWANLRLATRNQNKANSPCYRNNLSGFKGVSQRGKKFIARIRVNGQLLYLGRFASAEEAHAAYTYAATEHFGEFARAA